MTAGQRTGIAKQRQSQRRAHPSHPTVRQGCVSATLLVGIRLGAGIVAFAVLTGGWSKRAGRRPRDLEWHVVVGTAVLHCWCSRLCLTTAEPLQSMWTAVRCCTRLCSVQLNGSTRRRDLCRRCSARCSVLRLLRLLLLRYLGLLALARARLVIRSAACSATGRACLVFTATTLLGFGCIGAVLRARRGVTG